MERNEDQMQEEAILRERYGLVMERIRQIRKEETLQEPARSYFYRTAGFIEEMDLILQKQKKGEKKSASLQTLEEENKRLYEDIFPGAYETSFANPTFAVKCFGKETGQLLSFVYTEIRGMIAYAFEERLFDMTICCELFVEVYNLFELVSRQEMAPECLYGELKDAVYYFISDYCDVTVERRIREQLDPSLDFAVRIIMDSDLTDLRYLYQFGEFISENEKKTAEFLNGLSQEKIDAMAFTYTEGYRRGFELAGIDLSKKTTVEIRYRIGFERVIRSAVGMFEKMGLKPVIFRAAVNGVNKRQHLKIGYFGGVANPQYDYDHRFDNALFLDGAFKERKLAMQKVAYEACREEAAGYAGPAVLETFGEAPAVLVNKKEACELSEKQQRLSVALYAESGELVNQYIRGEERSFTIISFPIPEIGEHFEEIFEETIRLNTLDYEKYKKIQERLIEVLDSGKEVRIRGRRGNRTDLTVALPLLKEPEVQTNFENCLADVNIPLGEVFTSPKLTGTKGILHVSQIYLNEVAYKNLWLQFTDGMVTDYGCDNYPDSQAGRRLIRDTLLFNHDSLPMGEFAIGTNTTAYAMAKKYQIIERLKILIIEKMGPHFAIGDTCFSHAEEVRTFNPDGKEMVAKDNEWTLRRKTDSRGAYFNCHTDITIPYDELDGIWVVKESGDVMPVIEKGRFVLPGTEELNETLD